jgi:hypothetical protein
MAIFTQNYYGFRKRAVVEMIDHKKIGSIPYLHHLIININGFLQTMGGKTHLSRIGFSTWMTRR